MQELLDTLAKILKLRKILLELSPYNRSLHVVIWLVPFCIGLFWFFLLKQPSEMDAIKGSLSIIPLNSNIDTTMQIQSQKGLLIVGNNLDNTFKVSFNGKNAPPNVWTSLEPTSLRLNDDNISINGHQVLTFKTPLYGNNDVFGLVIEGESNANISIPGQSIPLSELSPESGKSISLLFSVLLVISFGAGLLLKEFWGTINTLE